MRNWLKPLPDWHFPTVQTFNSNRIQCNFLDDMDNSIHQKIVRQVFGEQSAIADIQPVSGGCIHSASRIKLPNGDEYFLKLNRSEFAAMFRTELFGLEQLAKTSTVRIPTPIESGVLNESAFLLLEWIEPTRPDANSSRQLGVSLAQLHLYQDENRFGFEIDNFIGSSPQANQWSESWPEFFVTRRLEPQLAMARDCGFRLKHASDESMLLRAEKLLPADCHPSLIHGDLWSGNYLIGPNGVPYLIDPAPYWGHHEAEFGILTLFGGFDSNFYDGYRELIPEEDGFHDRLSLYQLYHYLNHLNLFGSGYLSQCEQLLAEI